MIKAIIFDLGGVLACDVWEHLLLDKENGIASTFNLERTKVHKVGENLWRQFAHLAPGKEQSWEMIEVDYWNNFIAEFHLTEPADHFIHLTKKFIKPIPGMISLLAELQRKGIQLRICSNNTEFWFEHQMQQLKLNKFFDMQKVVLSSRVGVSKSSFNFGMYHAVMDTLDADRGCCLFIDDKQRNVENAIKYGMSGIIFPSHSKYGARYLRRLLKEMCVL